MRTGPPVSPWRGVAQRHRRLLKGAEQTGVEAHSGDHESGRHRRPTRHLGSTVVPSVPLVAQAESRELHGCTSRGPTPHISCGVHAGWPKILRFRRRPFGHDAGACRHPAHPNGPLDPHPIGAPRRRELECRPWTRSSPPQPRPSPTIRDGASLAVGGFGLCGIPQRSHRRAARLAASRDLEVVSNNCGVDDWGLGILLGGQADPPDDRVLRRREQGVRAPVPRGRARGRAHAAGHPRRAPARRRRRHRRLLHPDRCRHARSPTADCRGGTPPTGTSPSPRPPRRPATFGLDGESAPSSSRRASPPTSGSCAPGRATATATSSSTSPARNFNPLCAMAGRITIAEVEELVEPGELDPDEVHLPGHLRAARPSPDAGAGRRQADRAAHRPGAPRHTKEA